MYGTSEQPGQAPGETLTHDSDADQTARGEHPYPGISDDPRGSDGPGGPLDGPDGPENTADQDADTGDALRNRVTELEAANARLKADNTQLSKGMAELESENADLRRGMSALEARVERVEQSRQDKPAGEIADRAHAGVEADSERSEHRKERRVPSDEALLFGAAGVGGAVTTASYYLSFVRPDVAGITASLLAAGAAGVAWMHKRREARYADRPKN